MTRDEDPRPDVSGAPAPAPRTIRFDDLAGDDGGDLPPHQPPAAWRASAPPAEPVPPRSSLDEPTAPLRVPPLPPAAPSTAAPSTAAPSTAAPSAATPSTPPVNASRRTLVFDDLSSARAPEPASPVAATPPARPTPSAAPPSRPRPGDARRTPAPAVTAPAAAPAADEPPTRERVPVGRALAGAALAISGVALGIVVLLWITDDPDRDTVADGLGAQVSQSAVEPDPSVESTPEAQVVPPAAPAPAPPPVAPPAPPTTASATPVVPVTVLNNSRRSGLAARAAAAFEEGGWPVAATGNFRGRIPVTTVYYDPGLEASAQALADSFDGIARVRPRFETLPARGVVVVVTREFAT